MEKFKPCNICKNGFIYFTENDIETIKPCKCLIEYRAKYFKELKYKENNITDFNKTYNLNTDYLGADKQNNKIKINKYLREFKTRFFNKHLYFFGTNGTQKTTISKYMCKYLIDKGLEGYHILTDSLIKMLIDSDRDDMLKSKIEVILNKDLLVIDEFDPPKVCVYASGYQLSFLTSFLKTRLEYKKKATIFISNSKITDPSFKEKFNFTIQNLIQRELYDTLTFEDIYAKEESEFDVSDLWK
jgi:hypothetical protein